MRKMLSILKKLILIILCFAVLVWLYYLTMIRPYDDFWEECEEILSGNLQPDVSHPLWVNYRLDGGKPYSLATEVKLDINRHFVWRLGNHGGMSVNFTQEYYDKDGNYLTRDQCFEEWTLEKIDGKWMITDVRIPDIYPK